MLEFLNDIRKSGVEDVDAYYSAHKDEINMPNERGITPLIAALSSGRIEMIECILKLGADANYTTDKSTLPLIAAIDYAMEEEDYSDTPIPMRLDTIEILLKFGANIFIKDVQENENAYQYSKGRHLNAQKLFEKNIAEQKNNNKTENGWSVFDGLDD